MPSGVGRAIGLSTSVFFSDWGVNSSPMIPGPFVVVAVWMRSIAGGAFGAELTVVPQRRPRVDDGAGRAEVEGARFMVRQPQTLVAGDWHIGDPYFYPDSVYLWPWYVYEGSAGALALWVQGSVFTEPIVQVMVSVWGLKVFQPAGARREDEYTAAAARVAEWRRLVERELRARWR